MVNEKRIITMANLALYSEGDKKKSMKVCSFFKKDYVTFQTIMTLLWATVGYGAIVATIVFVRINELTSSLSIDLIKELAILIIGCYFLCLFAMGTIAILYYTYEYNKSLKVVKQYYRALGQMNKNYKREK